MPKYYNIDGWGDRGKIKIIPMPWYRNLPILKDWLDYHVGDKIKFKLQMEKINTHVTSGFFHHIIMEKIGDDERQIATVDEIDNTVIGTRIYAEESISYKICSSVSTNDNEGCFLTTTVQSWDTVRTGCFWMIASAILGAILGGVISLFASILLGFIQIVPERIIWWPW